MRARLIITHVVALGVGAATVHFGEVPVAQAVLSYAMSHGHLYLTVFGSNIDAQLLSNSVQMAGDSGAKNMVITGCPSDWPTVP